MQKLADGGAITSINGGYLDMSNFGPISSQILELHKDMAGLFMLYDVDLGSVVGNEYNKRSVCC